MGLVAVAAAFAARLIIASGHGLAYEASTLQWIIGICILLITVVVVVVTGFYNRWLFWRTPDEEPVWVSAISMLLARFVMIITFATATVLLASSGLVHIRGWSFITRAEMGSAREAGFATSTWTTGEEILGSVEAHYLWHLLDAVPQLKVPQRLSWELEHEVEGFSGGIMLLIFKILVVLPVITFFVTLVRSNKRSKQDSSSAPSS